MNHSDPVEEVTAHQILNLTGLNAATLELEERLRIDAIADAATGILERVQAIRKARTASPEPPEHLPPPGEPSPQGDEFVRGFYKALDGFKRDPEQETLALTSNPVWVDGYLVRFTISNPRAVDTLNAQNKRVIAEHKAKQLVDANQPNKDSPE